ncbi:hypothetical protein CDAR_462951 [Caerostris darwini]|uniref:Uncharacterized protein n=1 Tax=Caerostris darwini TaxID=1538125 RepID=A0AAV4QAR6_9ARAC|nr:hypothetical protein CDAR_462951 [Caerostris darwini]
MERTLASRLQCRTESFLLYASDGDDSFDAIWGEGANLRQAILSIRSKLRCQNVAINVHPVGWVSQVCLNCPLIFPSRGRRSVVPFEEKVSNAPPEIRTP